MNSGERLSGSPTAAYPGNAHDPDQDADRTITLTRMTCDQCRRRKVKCDGSAPCKRCRTSQLNCQREDVPKRRGPKSGRGSTITRLRQSQSLGESVAEDAEPRSSPVDTRIHTASTTTPASSEDTRDSGCWDVTSETDTESVILRHSSDSVLPGITSAPLGHSAQRSPPKNTFQGPEQHLSTPTLGYGSSLSSGSPNPSKPNLPRSHSVGLPWSGLDAPPRSTQSDRYWPMGSVTIARELDLSPLLITECIHKFFRELYSIMPLVDEDQIWTKLYGTLDPPSCCLILALCSITLLRTPSAFDLALQPRLHLAQRMVRKCDDLRQMAQLQCMSGFDAVVTSYVISLSYFDLQQPTAHQHYLGEAVELAGRLERPVSTAPTWPRFKQLERVLYVTEVSSGIQRGHNRRTAFPYEPDVGYESPNLGGMQNTRGSLLETFRTLDSLFFLPSGEHTEPPGNPRLRTSISQAQASLADRGENKSLTITPSQRPDLLVTRQWSRLIIWQLSLKMGFVSGADLDPAFGYSFPLAVSSTLCSILKTLSMEMVQMHGLGIHEKIFEIANALLDLISVKHAADSAKEDFAYLLEFLEASPLSRGTYVSILKTKLVMSEEL